MRAAGVLAGLALSLGACGVASAATGSAVTARLGVSRAMPADFFGVNYDYGGASVYVKDDHVTRQLGALAPGTLRWPGGTSANYFQWREGYPEPASAGGKCSASTCETDGFRFTIADLAAAYRASGAIPIFDLNVMTSTLTQQIDMLKAAQHTGKLPVKYVELGNEFYLSNADYVQAFPTAKDYGMAVAADVKALHKAFPGVLVAAVGSANSASARESGWNTGMLSEATGAGTPDAITLHSHPQYNKSLTVSGLPALFTLPYTSTSDLAAVSKPFGATPTWITEYGLSLHWSKGNPAQDTYANALWETEAAILIAQDVRNATLVNYWAAFGPAVSYAYTSSGLTPVGLAMTWLDHADGGARTGTPLLFANGPRLGSSGDQALVGESFAGVRSRAEVIVNLSGNAVVVLAGAAIPSGARYEQVTGQPVKQVSEASQLTVTHGVIGQSVTLAPYSITVAG